jgi:hypothetical protein
MNTLQSQWEEFERLILPKGGEFSEVQRKEMKRAFYCGAQSVLVLMFNMSDGSIGEDAAVLMIEQWHDECRQFGKDVQAGKS